MPIYVTMLNHCHWSEQLLHIDCIIGTQCHASCMKRHGSCTIMHRFRPDSLQAYMLEPTLWLT